MARRQLAPEVISLIHHVKLNEAGWWNKAVNQVVLAIFWGRSKKLSVADATRELRSLASISIAEATVREHILRLTTQGKLLEFSGEYQLSSHSRKEMDLAHNKASAEQAKCRAAFIELCDDRVPQLDAEKLWNGFSKALAHAVSITGANLYRLLADGRMLKEIDWPRLLLNKFEPEDREGIRSVLDQFLSGGNEACRSVILRHLNAHFFAEAAQLSQATIRAIEQGRRRRIVKVVLDTNFIFSVLNLHDNPGDDSALSLFNLVSSGKADLEIRLYVLPSTLEEAKRSLNYQQRLIERVRATPNVARAALSQPLPSIARKFFDVASKAEGLSAHEYFEPYIEGLQAVLRERGIHVLEASPQVYALRQDVIDDTLEEQRRENSEVPESKRKGYEKILHDVVLWHAVHDRRPVAVSTPFDIEYWGVTVDWSLIGFDRRKRTSGSTALPVLLHPSNLLQLLQFWVPRSAALEEGLIDTLRLPLMFQSFDPQDEKATIKVLEAISRFENVDDLPESTIKEVLANQALRRKLDGGTKSSDEIFELVREQLLQEHKEVVERLALTTSSLETATKVLAQTTATADSVQQELASTKIELKSQMVGREADQREWSTRESELRGEVDRTSRAFFVALFIALPLIGGLLLGITAFVLSNQLSMFLRSVITAAVMLLPAAIAFPVASRYIASRPHLSQWRVSRFVSWIGLKVIVLPILLVLTGILQGFAWDAVKSFVGWGEVGHGSISAQTTAPVDD